MQILKTLLIRPLAPVPNKVAILVLLIAIIGFADAGYLTVEHFQGVVPPCKITTGCEQVLTSPYSVVLGLPVSLLGAIYYALVAAGSFAYLEGKHERLFRWSLGMTIFGLIASIWFVFLQAFIIHSYCAYCLCSALTSTILFVVACFVFKKYSPESPASTNSTVSTPTDTLSA